MAVVVGIVAFVLMEPVTAALHRWLFHGSGWRFHRSHHVRRGGGVEANDLFPLGIAVVTVGIMAAGASVAGLRPLLWVGAGMTAYGAAYFLVHDVYIHRRLPVLPRGLRLPVLERLREAHGVHHAFDLAPYGMLVPVVPGQLRARAEARAEARGEGATRKLAPRRG